MSITERSRVGRTLIRVCSIVASCALVLAAAGCVRPQNYIDITCGKMSGETLLDRELAIQCQQFKQDEAATAIYNEATLLMKSYRSCLDKYEQTPARARESCSLYAKALSQRWEPRDCQVGEALRDKEAALKCQQIRQEAAANAIYNEAMLLLQSYRACLEKYEPTPVRAREYCAMYGKALQDIGLQIKEPLDANLTGKETAQTPSKSKF
jgi:hypothetical protein